MPRARARAQSPVQASESEYEAVAEPSRPLDRLGPNEQSDLTPDEKDVFRQVLERLHRMYKSQGAMTTSKRPTSRTLRDLRNALGVSQAVFAHLLGVSLILVKSWERGTRQPSLMARRLLDTIKADPARWLTTVSEIAAA
jgi:putative transcriptional regulator